MPLQNRVDPFGAIHAVSERGLFTGNRGIIHDPATRTLLKRRWTTRAWIVCATDFRNRRRIPMAGRSWTELFFLDEVTALAAGHRPCFTCRKDNAKSFLDCYAEAFPEAEPRVTSLDARLHAERPASNGRPVPLHAKDVGRLPHGTMIASGCDAYAVRDGRLLRWSFEGYDDATDFNPGKSSDLRLVTPPTTLAILRAGYCPLWHR